eukprot:TRINITY_DN64912_c0_g1_i1.p1 TRINITY_DN64912_c0_g1~~TRINITY_DN64912_c0_g1_i1.p1  ORF type:complete len:262 (+),score=130.16 TRINITY_DN64912_c0_g1_i1:72-857(+)
MGSPELSLRARVGFGLACIGLPLLGALAYNLGFVSSEDSHAAVVENYQGINRMVRERIQQCTRKEKERKQDGELEEMDLTGYREEQQLLYRENDLLHSSSEHLRETAEACNRTRDDLQAERMAAGSVQDQITLLEFENDALMETVQEINESNRAQRVDLATRVRALRLENKQMRANIEAVQSFEEKQRQQIQQLKEEQRQLQERDFGFGELGAPTSFPADIYKKMDQGLRADKDAAADMAAWDASMEQKVEGEDPDALKWD